MSDYVDGARIRLGHIVPYKKLTKSVLDKKINVGYIPKYYQYPKRTEDAMKVARFFLLFNAFVVGAYFLVFRTASPSHAQLQSSGGGSPCCTTLAPRELDFPYYNLTNGWISTLYLVSDSPQTMDFTLLVKGAQGQALTAAETIQPRQKLAIDMGSLITQLGGDPTGAFAQGSVSVYYVGTIMPIVGQITLSNPQLSLVYESVMVEHDPGRSDIPAVLNGVWWGLGGGRTASVMVSNTSANAQTAQVYLDFQGQRHALQNPLRFASYETKVLDITQLLASLGVDPAQAPEGGITIVPSGATPTLIASGRIADPTSGFSSTMDFPAPDLEHASALHATGVPVGTPGSDSPFAGAGTFTPHVVVRNLSSSPQTVTVTLEYPQVAAGNGSTASTSAPLDPVAAQDGKHSPPTVQRPLAPVTLPAYSAQDISLDSLTNQLPTALPFCSLRIQYSGAPGSLQAQVSSVESAGDLVVDSHVQNEGNGWAGSGANPWHLDDDTESILFLTNESNQPARIGFKVTANGSPSYYLTKLQLNAHETRAIDLRKLRDAQQPDLNNNTVPAAATDGSVIWVRIDNLPVMGRLVQIHRQQGMASNYDCETCPCANNYEPSLDYVTPGSSNLLVGDTVGLTYYSAYETCNDDVLYYNANAYTTWTSQNPNIASVNSAGTATGQSAGTTQIGGQYTGDDYTYSPDDTPECSASPVSGGAAAQVSVYTPAYAVFNGQTGPYSPGCGKGIYRNYEVYDSATAPPGGHLIQSAMNWTLHETGNPSCGMILGSTELGVVTFTDQIANCQAGCTAQINQGFSVVYKGYNYGLQAKDCPTCAVHNGWHLTVTTTSPYVTVTDN